MQSQITRYVNYHNIFFYQHIKMLNPKEIESLETVIELKVIEKLELERINKVKELKQLENNNKKELQELEIEKTNKTLANSYYSKRIFYHIF